MSIATQIENEQLATLDSVAKGTHPHLGIADLYWGLSPKARKREEIKRIERARVRAWRAANPERWREHKRAAKQRRRAMNAGTFVEKVDERLIFERTGNACAICRKPLVFDVRTGPDAWNLDHIIPLAKGGRHAHDNVQALCRCCNSSKGRR